MKKAFLLLCTLLLVLGSLLPLAGYRLAKAVLGEAAASSEVPASSALPAPGGSLPGTDTGSPETAAFTGDAEVFLIEDQSTGEVQQVPRRDYLIGAVAAEMPLSWPDEALKAQAVAAHSYVLYCRDHATAANGAWLSADPARRQGYLTDAVLHSYWGTRYDANYIRLSALVDSKELPPMIGIFSRTMVFKPLREASMAAAIPAPPAPTTTKSAFSVRFGIASR